MSSLFILKIEVLLIKRKKKWVLENNIIVNALAYNFKEKLHEP